MKTSRTVLILRTGYFSSLLLMPAVHASAQMRVVAVADSHGAYRDLVAILERAGLIDGNRQWIGGSSVLVRTGDVIDRGKGSRECLDLLIDTGMNKEVYGGRGPALEFRDGSVTAYYTGGEPQVLVAPGGGATTPASRQDKSGGKPES